MSEISWEWSYSLMVTVLVGAMMALTMYQV
jgi:hypothetical protein